MPLPIMLGGLMDHDPLCPWRQAEESDSALGLLAGVAVCECDLIDRVRQDMLARCISLPVARVRLHEHPDGRWIGNCGVPSISRAVQEQP